MREIKFRVWIGNTKEMLDVWEIDFNINQVIVGDDNEEIWSYYYSGHKQDCDLMQFTGRIDKNGKEVFESDFLQDQHGVGEVVWLDSRGGWAVSTENEGYFYPHSYGEYQLKNTEVIGNKYENPELLKELCNCGNPKMEESDFCEECL